jgi:hypothetical protein
MLLPTQEKGEPKRFRLWRLLNGSSRKPLPGTKKWRYMKLETVGRHPWNLEHAWHTKRQWSWSFAQKNAGVALVDANLADMLVKNQCGNEVQEDVVVSKLDRLVADRGRQRVVPLVSNLLDQLRQSVEDGTC